VRPGEDPAIASYSDQPGGAASGGGSYYGSTGEMQFNPHYSSPAKDAGPPSRDAPAANPQELGSQAFQRAWRLANEHIAQAKYRDALATLTPFYGSPDLTAEENRRLLDLLDPLAGKVIYSTEHHLLDPYAPRRGETLHDIAQQLDVPWQLLQNINGISDPTILPPGTQLKVVRGPFRAEVNLEQSQLTLFVDALYAGRFDLAVANARSLIPGQYMVRSKEEWKAYETPDGRRFPPRHPDNPYGQWYLHLAEDVSIHGSPTENPAAPGLGCIRLSPRDAEDVYGILSQGSKVEIRRR
jgi:hypothetical protein